MFGDDIACDRCAGHWRHGPRKARQREKQVGGWGRQERKGTVCGFLQASEYRRNTSSLTSTSVPFPWRAGSGRAVWPGQSGQRPDKVARRARACESGPRIFQQANRPEHYRRRADAVKVLLGMTHRGGIFSRVSKCLGRIRLGNYRQPVVFSYLFIYAYRPVRWGP